MWYKNNKVKKKGLVDDDVQFCCLGNKTYNCTIEGTQGSSTWSW